MAETVQGRILRYLQEAHASEHHLEKVFRGFADSHAGSNESVYLRLAERASSHQSSLEAAINRRGSSVSRLRSVLVDTLAFAPLHARVGDTTPERDVQRHVFAVAATSFQMAAYASLAAGASVVRDDDASTLARRMLAEEQSDLEATHGQDVSAVTIVAEHRKMIVAFLEDAIAAEHSFESQSGAAAKRAKEQPEAHVACALFTEHAKATREDFEQLTRRLESLGAEPSILKGFFAEVFNSAPKWTGLGHERNEQLSQDLMALYATAHAEMAMYGELQRIAKAANDETTEALADAIRQTKRTFAEKAWAEIEPAATVSIATMPYATSY